MSTTHFEKDHNTPHRNKIFASRLRSYVRLLFTWQFLNQSFVLTGWMLESCSNKNSELHMFIGNDTFSVVWDHFTSQCLLSQEASEIWQRKTSLVDEGKDKIPRGHMASVVVSSTETTITRQSAGRPGCCQANRQAEGTESSSRSYPQLENNVLVDFDFGQ